MEVCLVNDISKLNGDNSNNKINDEACRAEAIGKLSDLIGKKFK